MKTQHTHHPLFGRRIAGCPRCAELAAGAAPRRWHRDPRMYVRVNADVLAHFAPGGPHERGACGPVCTFGDW